MKIDFENLGTIEKGSIELNDLTLLCGKNNSGKTYAMYSFYSILNKDFHITFDFVKPILEKLKSGGVYPLELTKFIADFERERVCKIENYFKNNLPNLFGVTEDKFINTKVRLEFNKVNLSESIIPKKIDHKIGLLSIYKKVNDKIITLKLANNKCSDSFLYAYISGMLKEHILPDVSGNSFLLPAERAGLNLFYKELFSIRNASLQRAQNDNIDSMDVLKDILNARYAQPVKDYMQFLNEVSSTREESSIFNAHAQKIQNDILHGQYEVDEFGNVFFIPDESTNKLPLHFSSSTVKTLFGLVFYLNHLAKDGDCLMIDEPELNLHPDNQRKIARVIVQLINAGLKVIISTHSNYFIREINNLIMLKSDFSGAEDLRKKYGYQENELLNHHKVSAYLFNDKKITAMEQDDEGIIVETFDTVTSALNQSSNEIYYAMQDAKELDD